MGGTYAAGHKLKFSTKFWYAVSDIYGGGAFNIINFYYAFFPDFCA